MNKTQLTELLQSLSLKEKIGQLVQLDGGCFGVGDLATGPQAKLGIEPWVAQHAGSVLNVMGAERVRDIQARHLEHSRIPLLFMADIVYGYKTVYPMPLALASSWEPQLAQRCAQATAREAVADGAHVTFSPMVDVCRDARWGRCMESPGEDPLINARFAKAYVRGFQGGASFAGQGKDDGAAGASDDPAEHLGERGLVSCVKHFAGYGAVEAGREYNTVDMSRWRMVSDYLPPYRAAVEAGCGLVMTSFNTVEGVPATANRWLMRDVLRDEWGFDGVVITDYAAVAELVAHGVAANDAEAAELALAAGVDIDMKTSCYANQIAPLLEDGRLSIERVDEAVMRVLELKNRLGLFEDPYRGIGELPQRDREGAREAARRSMVLLRNEAASGDGGEVPVLPLGRGQKIALLGPYANSRDLMGLWAVYGDRDDVPTLAEAFSRELGDEDFRWSTGCKMLTDAEFASLGDFGSVAWAQGLAAVDEVAELARSIELAEWADVAVFAVGEHMLQSGESGSRTDLRLPASQRAWLSKVLPHAKKSVGLLFNGRPLELCELSESVNAILECWFPGTEGAGAAVDLLMGKSSPSGRLTMSFPRSVGQEPLYYAAFATGRPAVTSSHSGRFVSRYIDCANEPLYPFGFGLTYGAVEYGAPVLSCGELLVEDLAGGGHVGVSIEVVNKGEVACEEVVQLYVRDVAATVVRPVKELKDWKKVLLTPGIKRRVDFSLDVDAFSYVGTDLQKHIDAGLFEITIGSDSSRGSMAEFMLR